MTLRTDDRSACADSVSASCADRLVGSQIPPLARPTHRNYGSPNIQTHDLRSRNSKIPKADIQLGFPNIHPG